MDNPETIISPQTMYAYDTHRNLPWNETEYQPVKQYLDPAKQVSDRKYLETPKGGSPQNYVTKRGFYMDYHIKVGKAFPSSVDHPPKDPWDQEINKKKSNFHKLDQSLSKYNYLDKIAIDQKKRSTPAPGSYHLNKTQEEVDSHLKELKTKRRFFGDKHFFYEDQQFLSNNLGPGAGNCNPHHEVPNYRMNKTTHKFWIEKDKKLSVKMQKRHSVEPAPGTHTPVPTGYTTFDRIKTADETRRKKNDKKVTGFGSDSRFEYTRENKKKIVEQRPPPSEYNLVLEWKGKNADIKKDNWIRSRSYGPTQRVYN